MVSCYAIGYSIVWWYLVRIKSWGSIISKFYDYDTSKYHSFTSINVYITFVSPIHLAPGNVTWTIKLPKDIADDVTLDVKFKSPVTLLDFLSFCGKYLDNKTCLSIFSNFYVLLLMTMTNFHLFTAMNFNHRHIQLMNLGPTRQCI